MKTVYEQRVKYPRLEFAYIEGARPLCIMEEPEYNYFMFFFEGDFNAKGIPAVLHHYYSGQEVPDDYQYVGSYTDMKLTHHVYLELK